jgi:hypothetical protein
MITTPSIEILNNYATPGPFTDPREYTCLFDDLPTDLGELCRLVQNNLIHIFWADRYGRKLSEADKETVNVRSIFEKLARIQGAGFHLLTESRALEQRQVGNCRDFSVMLVSILRHKGIPARARCGFGTYFLPNHFEDHWVCEYWCDDQNRWILVDAQLDEFQCKELKVNFDPLDVPRTQFIVAGQAWQMCRRGRVEPKKFGIFEWHGWWFIWGNVIRELLAFNKIELLPWDVIPGCMTHNLEDPLAEGSELALYDGIAALTLAGDASFTQLRAIYEADARFQATSEILGQTDPLISATS